jgi:hypothetical protein
MTPRNVIAALLSLVALLVLLMYAAATGWSLPEWQMPCPKQEQAETP